MFTVLLGVVVVALLAAVVSAAYAVANRSAMRRWRPVAAASVAVAGMIVMGWAAWGIGILPSAPPTTVALTR